jgi:hypothetical protein
LCKHMSAKAELSLAQEYAAMPPSWPLRYKFWRECGSRWYNARHDPQGDACMQKATLCALLGFATATPSVLLLTLKG